MAQSKYFPDLENGKSIADVEQIETAFSLVEQDMANAGGKADQVFSPTSKNAQSGVAIAGELDKYVVKETGLTDYVKFTDYASYSKAGVAKVDPVGTKGISIDGDHFLTMVAASPSDISGRIGNGAITPLNLNAAVKAALTDGSRISNMTETEKGDARDVIGAEKMTKIAVETTSNVVLNDKVDTRVSSSVTTINLTIPTIVPPLYESALSFQSGTTATTLAYPGDKIKFVGADCDESGDFIPTANKNYEVIIKNLTTNEMTPVLVARVGVY